MNGRKTFMRAKKRLLLSLAVALALAFAMGVTPQLAGQVFASTPGAGGETAGSGSPGGPEIATWAGWRKAAASFTFDGGAPSHVDDAAPLFNRYGYKATFFLVTYWNPQWHKFQAAATAGHEVGSLSDTHPQTIGTDEIVSSKTNIGSKIDQIYGLRSLAYPHLNVPADEDAVLENYIAGRTGPGSWQRFDDINSKDGPGKREKDGSWTSAPWTRVSGLITGPEGTSDFIGKMQSAINKEGWVVFVTFGLQGKINGSASYSPTDINKLDEGLQWAKENDKDIWVTSFGSAVMYIKERNASTFALKESSNTKVTYSLTHQIADKVCSYEYPLDVRVPLPENWSEVTVKQDDIERQHVIKDGMIYFLAIPNGGDIVIDNGEAETDPTISSTAPGETMVGSPSTQGTEAAPTTVKKTNTLSVKGKTVKVKRSKVRKKTQRLAVTKVITFRSKGQGRITYAKASGNKKITIHKTTGKVTVKKGLKKGTYKVRIRVSAAGGAAYKPAVKTVTVKIRIK